MATTPSGLTAEEALSKQQQIKLPDNNQLFKVIGAGGREQLAYKVGGNLYRFSGLKDLVSGFGTGGKVDWKGRTQASWREEAQSNFLKSAGLKMANIPEANLADILGSRPKEIIVKSAKEFTELLGGKVISPAETKAGTTTPTAKTTEDKLTYIDLEDRDGTIYNKRTGKGYASPSELAQDLGITPNEIKWDKIQGDKVEYSDLEDKGGIITNTKTGKQYKNPAELAADLDILPHQIEWNRVSKPPTQPSPDPTPFDQTGDTGTTTGTGEYDPNDPFANIDTTGWSDQMMSMYTDVQSYIEDLIQQGQMINPYIELDEATLAGFLDQAQKEISPYYQQLTNQAKDDLFKTMEYNTNVFNEQEAALERKYGKNVESLGEEAAESGLVYSGRRKKTERELAEETQRTVGSNRDKFLHTAQGLGTQTERFVGSQALGGLNVPSLRGKPTVTAGKAGFQRTGEDLPVYRLSGGLLGDLEKQKEVAQSQRASQLEGVYRGKRAFDIYG